MVLQIVVGLVIIQRLAELLYSARNTRALKQDGAVEIGRGHYPLFILLHGTWLLSLLVLVPGDEPVHRPMLLIFAGLQVMRLWIVTALGRFWTTRIITIPNVPLVTRGPYRYLHHPNYLIVTIEIAVLPLAFGAFRIAVTFSVLNLLLLAWRIKLESAALEPRRPMSPAV
jgi:methyltransferase